MLDLSFDYGVIRMRGDWAFKNRRGSLVVGIGYDNDFDYFFLIFFSFLFPF